MSQRKGGTIQFAANGVVFDAKGEFTYNLGTKKRTGIVGADRPHGYKEEPQIPFIEGVITDRSDLDVKAVLELDGATVTLSLANGKVIVLRDAWQAGEGNLSTGEGELPVRFEGMSGEEI